MMMMMMMIQSVYMCLSERMQVATLCVEVG